jgi:hypothetical protein
MPNALAVPKPVDGWGLPLAPIATLSNVQAVRVVAAFTPEREVSSTVAKQRNFLIFVLSPILQFILGSAIAGSTPLRDSSANNWFNTLL